MSGPLVAHSSFIYCHASAAAAGACLTGPAAIIDRMGYSATACSAAFVPKGDVLRRPVTK
jgi:hypothetical protein